MSGILDLLLPSGKMASNGIMHIFTPQKVVQEMVDLLPEEVWNSSTTFLDIACKSGVYLVEIYKRLMKTQSLIDEYPDPEDREDHIFSKQLFGIALDIKTMYVSQAELYGMVGLYDNIKTIDGYIGLIKNKDKRFLLEKIKEKFGDMTFDVVIGNPPYQDTSNKAIYHYFVECAMSMNTKHIMMIVKNNWYNQYQFRGFRDKIALEYNLNKVVDYPIVGEIFPSIGVSACIIHLSKKNNAKSNIDTLFVSIINGIKADEFTQCFSKLNVIIPRKLDADIISKCSHEKRFNKQYTIANMWQKLHHKYDYSIIETPIYNLKYNLNKEPYELYLSNDCLSQNDTIAYQYKLVCALVINSAKTTAPGNVVTNIKIGMPKELFYDTWVTIAHSDSLEEIERIYKYAKTKFVRCLVNATVAERGNVTADAFVFVPLQDFSSSSDIDWSKSIEEIDKQLYAKYNLTEEEIAYIESTIKPMK